VAAHLVSVVVACGRVDVAVVVKFTVVELGGVSKWKVADALECSGCFQHRSHSTIHKRFICSLSSHSPCSMNSRKHRAAPREQRTPLSLIS
jgi:hypothetical protein